MNRLRKIARWLWLSKERMVLAVMVGFLCYRVYQVVQPEASDNSGTRAPDVRASKEPPPGMERPGLPPRLRRSGALEEVRSLWTRSMFRWTPRGPGVIIDGEDVQLSLIRIMDTGNGYRAQIKTEKSRKWYSEGASFESYELISIDPDTECCEIFAENIQKRVEVCIEE